MGDASGDAFGLGFGDGNGDQLLGEGAGEGLGDGAGEPSGEAFGDFCNLEGALLLEFVPLTKAIMDPRKVFLGCTGTESEMTTGGAVGGAVDVCGTTTFLGGASNFCWPPLRCCVSSRSVFLTASPRDLVIQRK